MSWVRIRHRQIPEKMCWKLGENWEELLGGVSGGDGLWWSLYHFWVFNVERKAKYLNCAYGWKMFRICFRLLDLFSAHMCGPRTLPFPPPIVFRRMWGRSHNRGSQVVIVVVVVAVVLSSKCHISCGNRGGYHWGGGHHERGTYKNH